MNLTISDYKSITNQVQEGIGCVEFEKDGEILTFDYELELDGYYEEETDGFNAMSTMLYIDNVTSCNEDGNTTNNFNESVFEKYVA